MTEPITYTANTLNEQILAECIEALDPKYDLIYVQYDDKLRDEQVSMLLRQDHEALWESFEEWESDARYDGARNIAAGVLKDVCEAMEREERVEYGQDAWDDFDGSEEHDELRFAIYDRDTGDWFRELIQHTGGVFLRIPLYDGDEGAIERASGYEDQWPSEIQSLLEWGIVTMPDRGDVAAVEAWLADSSVEANAAALRKIWGEIGDPASGFIDYKWPFLLAYVDVWDLYQAQQGEGITHVEVENPHLLLTNVYQGDGHEEQLSGWVRVPIGRLYTDEDAPGHSWDSIAGVVKSYYTCEFRPVPPITTEEKAA